MRVNSHFDKTETPDGVKKALQNHGRVLRKISFGDASAAQTEEQNIDGAWVLGTTNAAANTEKAFTHQLGRVPIGYQVFSKDKAGDFYDGATAWTDTTIYLKNSTASVTFKIMVF